MKESAEFGLNKTPTQLHRTMTTSMLEGYKEFPPQAEENSIDAFTLRQDYIQHSEQLGAVPLPATIRGTLNTGMQAIAGKNPAVLIDKLGERLAYERSGARLYDAFLVKCKAAAPQLDVSVIERFRNEEVEHFMLVQDCILAIGGDPTAQTPCADASGVASMGLVQLVNDPRSSIPQCVEAMLIAELTDVAAWDLLIELIREAGLEEFATKFEKAKATEDEHLETMQQWLKRMIFSNDTVPVVS